MSMFSYEFLLMNNNRSDTTLKKEKKNREGGEMKNKMDKKGKCHLRTLHRLIIKQQVSSLKMNKSTRNTYQNTSLATSKPRPCQDLH